MKTRLGIVTAVLTMVLTFWCGSAMAIIEGDCPEWVQPCIGRVELSDMGSFNGDQFVWNGPEATGMLQWDATLPAPFKEFDTGGGTFQIRRYPAGVVDPQVRVSSNLFGEAIFAPVIWKSTDSPASYFMDAQAPGNCGGPDGMGYMMTTEECAATYPEYAQDQGNDCENQPEYCHRDGTDNHVYYDGGLENHNVVDGTPLCQALFQNGIGCASQDYADFIPCMELNLCFDEPIPGGWDPANPDMNADPNVDDCCKLWGPRFEQVSKQDLPFEDIAEVRWVEKDVVGFKEYRSNWGLMVKYGLYPLNFWDYANAWVWDGPDFNIHFSHNILPDANTVQTVTYTLTDGRVFTKQFTVTDTSPMPTVSATKEVVGGDDKVTIHTKQKKIGLKLTWNDPPFNQIMRPGLQLRVYAGKIDQGLSVYNSQDISSNMETFYWIDCPAQMHKVLIPDVEWQALKDRLLAAGHTEVDIMIVYRTIEPDDNFGTQYMNRGHSEVVTLPLQ